jgi:acylphosphatase
VTCRWLISGLVQGVGFRYFVLREARALALAGWVRNLSDGRVEVVANGGLGDLELLEELITRGPPHAQVSRVDKSDVSDELVVGKTFEIK